MAITRAPRGRGMPTPKRPPRGSALGMHLTTAGAPIGMNNGRGMLGADGQDTLRGSRRKVRKPQPKAQGMRQDWLDAGGDPLKTRTDEELEAEADAKDASQNQDMLAIYQVKSLITGVWGSTASEDSNKPGCVECFKIMVDNDRFEYFVSVVIMLDLIVLALETDYYDENSLAFDVLAYVFVALFTLELLLRIGANHSNLWRKVMITDTFIVCFSIADVVLRTTTNSSLGLSALKVFRVFRLVRILRFAKVIKVLPPLHLLSEAISNAAQPLFFALMVTLLLLLAFAVMMAMLVPDAVKDGVEVEEMAMKHYGTIPRAILSLLIAMTGSPEWGLEPGFVLLQEGKFSSIMLLAGMILSAFILFLALSGLVTGVFLEQLFDASSRADDVADRHDLSRSHEALRSLDSIFIKAGFTGNGEKISWREVESIFKQTETEELLESLNLDIDDANRLFLHLDTQGTGLVEKDEFVFALFKLRSVSRSIDMLSVDYQQEQALENISKLHGNLKKFSGALQQKFVKIQCILPQIRQDISDVNSGIEEIRQLEERLLELRGEPRSADQLDLTGALDLQELRANLELARRLEALEEAAASLSSYSPPAASADALTPASDEAIREVAAEIAKSVQATLGKELGALREVT